VKANYTSASWKALVNNPVDREAELSRAAESFGVRVHNFYFAFGDQDVVVLMEASVHNTLLAFLMTVAGSGAATGVQTMVPFTSAEAKTAMATAKAASSAYAIPGAEVDVAKIHDSPGYHRPYTKAR
jgi:uncharacterized protein with GYD domain